MVRLIEKLNRIAPSKVMLVGDFMLDTYTIGRVKRISPEAPVSVLQVEKEEQRPGGAGNAVLNLLSLGAEVVAVGRVGQDLGGELLRKVLQQEGVDIRGLLVQHDYQTPVKNRIIAENQQMMRVDFERVLPLSKILEEEVYKLLNDLIQDVKVVAISDYAKGFLTKDLLKYLIELARSRGVPVIVDPKGTDFVKYYGATIIKPNFSEALFASGLPHDSSLDDIASKLLHETQIDSLFITRSEHGISLFQKEVERLDFPVNVREVKDVTGAGDTVLAMLTTAVANGFNFSESAMLANIAAGIAIEHFGCARVPLCDVARRLLQEDSSNKIFDEEQIFALHMAMSNQVFTLLSIDGALGLTSSIFKSIRKLSYEKVGELIVYVRTPAVNEEFLSLLASLQEVDFIIIKEDSLYELCKTVKPHEIYLLKDDKLEKVHSPEVVIS